MLIKKNCKIFTKNVCYLLYVIYCMLSIVWTKWICICKIWKVQRSKNSLNRIYWVSGIRREYTILILHTGVTRPVFEGGGSRLRYRRPVLRGCGGGLEYMSCIKGEGVLIYNSPVMKEGGGFLSDEYSSCSEGKVWVLSIVVQYWGGFMKYTRPVMRGGGVWSILVL